MNRYAFGICLLLSSCVLYADVPPATRASADAVIPELDLNGVGLDDAVNSLRKVSALNIVISRAAGVPADEPRLGVVQLKNVTATQVLDLLPQICPAVSVSKVDGAAGPIFVLSVRTRAVVLNGAGTLTIPASEVHVYRLNTFVDDLVQEQHPEGLNTDDPKYAEARKKALDDILSLIQAATEVGGEKSDMKVHEATSTLIFKGSPGAVAAVQETFAALSAKPKVEESAVVSDLRQQLATAQADVERMKKTADDLQTELDRKTIRLEELEKTATDLSVEKAVLAARLEVLSARSGGEDHPTTRPLR